MSSSDTHAHAPHDDGHGHHDAVRAEPDIIKPGPILGVLVVVLVVFALGVVWAIRMMRNVEASFGPGYTTSEHPKPISEAGKYEVGIVNQEQFSDEKRAYKLLGEQREAMTGYGWDDRAKGTIHVPVEKGVEAFLKSQGSK